MRTGRLVSFFFCTMRGFALALVQGGEGIFGGLITSPGV